MTYLRLKLFYERWFQNVIHKPLLSGHQLSEFSIFQIDKKKSIF